MIRINKNERNYLISHGVGIGENGISRTYSHKKSWYMAETPRNMKIYNNFKNECVRGI